MSTLPIPVGGSGGGSGAKLPGQPAVYFPNTTVDISLGKVVAAAVGGGQRGLGAPAP
jgi:hypothetical protein